MGRRGRAGFRRSGGGGGGGGSGAGASFQSIFGSNLRYLFDARFLSAAGSWTDLIQGYNVTAIGAPAYAADGGNFSGLPVHQTAVAGPAVLRLLTPAPVIWLAGARPYIMAVARFRNYPAGTTFLMRVLDSSGGVNTINIQTSGGINLVGTVDAQTGTAAFSDTNVHVFEVWDDPSSGVTSLAIDGTVVGTGGAGGSLANNSNHLSFGGSHTGALPCDSSQALELGCVSKPTDGQRAQAIALARQIWGF